jgi:hypothetical protein
VETIDVAELGARAAALLKDQRDFDVIEGGRVIGRVTPTRLRVVVAADLPGVERLSPEEWRRRWDKLTADISRKWSAGPSVEEEIREGRRG